VALGSMPTPLDMAGAYPLRQRRGEIDPWLVASVRSASGAVLNDTPKLKTDLDPGVAYLTLALMEERVNAGTGATIRAMALPPLRRARRHFPRCMVCRLTSNLLCVVWIGNDDYTDIKQEGR